MIISFLRNPGQVTGIFFMAVRPAQVYIPDAATQNGVQVIPSLRLLIALAAVRLQTLLTHA